MRSLPGLVWSTQFRARGRYTKSDGRGATPLTGLIEVADGVADVSGLGSRRSGSCDSRAHALRCAREWPLCTPSPSMQSTFSLSPHSPLFFSFFIILGVEGVDLRPALEGCGETKWYARAASSHHCKAAFGFAFVVWRTTSAQIHVKR